MAKSSRGTRPSAARPQTLLTLAERRILDSSVGRALSDATQKQLQATLAKARTLRDKWRDLFKRQTMATKRSPRTAEQANTRSLDKSELFAAAVKRIEARIAEAAEAVSQAVASMEQAAAGRSAKASRPDAAKPVASKPARKQAPARGPAPKPAIAAARPVKSGAVAPAAPSKKARQAGKRKALAGAATGQAIGYDPKKQRSAKASATRTQIKLDGLSTRRRGHGIASGKRKQARRDGR